jgi:hypothetical protein
LWLGIEPEAECPNDPVEVVFAVVFDLDPAAFLAMVNLDVRGQMLLEAIFEVA